MSRGGMGKEGKKEQMSEPQTVADLVARELAPACPVERDATRWSLIVGEGDEEGGQIILTIEPFASAADMVQLGMALQKIGEELGE